MTQHIESIYVVTSTCTFNDIEVGGTIQGLGITRKQMSKLLSGFVL